MFDLDKRDERYDRLEARLQRERRARNEAEHLLEAKSRELFEANEALRTLATSLEQRVKERTDELVEAHRRAIDLVERDPLTGLVNRRRFVNYGEEIVENCLRQKRRVAFLIVDIDRFKEINDSFGHEAGDAVLQHVARQFRSATRRTDIVARLGGDEFCMIVPDVIDPTVLSTVIDRFRLAMQEPTVYAGKLLQVEASMGYALFPDHGASLSEVMRHADMALYASKASGRGHCTAVTPHMQAELAKRQELESDLRRAIREGGLEPWYQPITDVMTGRTFSVEALMRWRRDDGTVLAPGAFLNIAEDCGLMHHIFSKILRASLRDIRPHIGRHLDYVTVNLSPSQFKFDTLIGDVATALDEADFPADALVLEVTEQVLLTDFERARQQLLEIAKRGVSIALDDFGNGYANISYLRQLPIEKVKLDRSMTADITTDPKSRAIVAGIASLATSLDLKIIAEGVETEEQSHLLELSGCRYQQGYLFARPMPARDLAQFLDCSERIPASRIKTVTSPSWQTSEILSLI